MRLMDSRWRNKRRRAKRKEGEEEEGKRTKRKWRQKAVPGPRAGK